METKENFLITGYGRSGTKYLADMFSKSKTWVVYHEPRMSDDEKYKGVKQTRKIQTAFNKNKYGEVNSYLRFHYKNLSIGKIGIIIRNPIDIYLSVCNRKAPKTHQIYLSDICNAYKQFFDDYENKAYFFLKFEDYIGKPSKVVELANYLGIEDIKIADIITSRVNKNKTIKYQTIKDLPKSSLVNIEKLKELENIYNETKNYLP